MSLTRKSILQSVQRWAVIGSLGIVVTVFAQNSYAQNADAPANDSAAPADASAPAEPAAPVPPADAAAPATEKAPVGDIPAGVEAQFADYLHFARMGKFDAAELYAAALLANAEFTPEKALALSEKYRNSRETLIMLVDSSSIRENAAKILKRVRDGEADNRKSPKQIADAIDWLSGDPTQRAVGLDRLQYAGEYAIPWVVDRLRDSSKKDLYPYIERVLPKIGKGAVSPLVIALQIKEDSVRETLIDALGSLGYPQALPYLARIAQDGKQTDSVRKTARESIQKILKTDPALKEMPAPVGFLSLAEMYYTDTPSLRANESEEMANVWTLKDNALVPIAIPRQIYNSVMCMRCCEDALALQSDMLEAVALWSAANFRREAELGMNVQSVEADPKALADRTRSETYPRSLYFARSFGTRYALMTLARGIKDSDTPVALGAVTALDGIASVNAMVGPDEAKQPLVSALSFPDVLVRITAALSLAKAMPPQNFQGSHLVIPILASAIDLRGTVNVLVIDPVESSRQLVTELAQKNGGTVIATATLSEAVNQARQQMAQVDLVVLSSELKSPGVVEAIKQIKADDRLALAPLVIAAQPGSAVEAINAGSVDRRIERFIVRKAEGLSNEEMTQLGTLFAQAWAQAGRKFGHQAISPEQSLKLSLAAADALRRVAMSGTSVFKFKVAEPALIRACSHTDETLRLKVAAVLAWSDSAAAQAAIAQLALDAAATEMQRVAAFDILAESAKRVGKKMSDDLIKSLIDQSMNDANLTIRTAASQALGAFNLAGGRAAEIIQAQAAK